MDTANSGQGNIAGFTSVNDGAMDLIRADKFKSLDTVFGIIGDRHDEPERSNLRTFAETVFSSLKNRAAILRHPPEDIYVFILGYYLFFEEAGLGGRSISDLIVRAFNPRPDECGQAGLEENTAIYLHTVNRPFIFESVSAYLAKKGYRVFGSIHPVFRTIRGADGKLEKIFPPDPPPAATGGKPHFQPAVLGGEEINYEIFQAFYISKIVHPEHLASLEEDIYRSVDAVARSVRDYEPMKDFLGALGAEISSLPEGAEFLAVDTLVEHDDAVSFTRWLAGDTFVMIGAAEAGQEGIRNTTALGMLGDSELVDRVVPGYLAELAGVADFLLAETGPERNKARLIAPLLRTASNVIHHPDPVDTFLFRLPGKNGAGPKVFIVMGRFSSAGSIARATEIPVLRTRFRQMLLHTSIPGKRYSDSYYYRQMNLVFNSLPKRVLMELSGEILHRIVSYIARFQSDDEVRVMADPSQWSSSFRLCVIYSAKKHGALADRRMAELLEAETACRYTHFEPSTAGPASILFVSFDRAESAKLEIDIEKCETAMRGIITSWDEAYLSELVQSLGDHEGYRLYNAYHGVLDSVYKELVSPGEAVTDTIAIDRLSQSGRKFSASILHTGPGSATIKIKTTQPIPLMDSVPTFRNFGIDIASQRLHPFGQGSKPASANGAGMYYLQTVLAWGTPDAISVLAERGEKISAALEAVHSGKTENGPLNSLVLSAGLDWRYIDALRCARNLLLQLDTKLNPASVTTIMTAHPALCAALAGYFRAKFDPAFELSALGARAAAAESEIERMLKKIAGIAEDRVFRGLYLVIRHTVRTNFYRLPEPVTISIKVESAKLPVAPLPRPMAEIYVHGPELEGVHLRGGKIARGGLRWSDRPDDFRAEILGLMKTQMVKNSIIVPVGAKGGFFFKDRRIIYGPGAGAGWTSMKADPAGMKRLYTEFIRALLDITDNFGPGGEEIRPERVVCHDGFDPYLVVAADKGTAMMSDTANSVSAERNFWLGDAFASGGKVGYDHKKMGITARGAWECAKRHFRELGMDIQTDPVRIAGIGAMSGDVFGNGMLLSRSIKLVAAFTQDEIFIDPDPDPESSYAERERLFSMPGSKWADYLPARISAGGGVFSRFSKAVPLSPEMKYMFRTELESVSGEELVKMILTLDVDMIYNGGIGTYIKSSAESHQEVADKANDFVRVNARDLKCRAVIEGGNLGVTQKGRLEFDLQGGRINTDAVDNSAGVDTSDHEVNIKILLAQLAAAGSIPKGAERDTMFMSFAGRVAELVLEDNYLQSAAITIDQARSAIRPDLFYGLIASLESRGLIARDVESIPADAELDAHRVKTGSLPRPLIALLLGYAKMDLFNAILSSRLPDDPFFRRYVAGYFPEKLAQPAGENIYRHRLAREIAATVASNRIVNQAGTAFVRNIERKTGRPAWEIARAYILADELLAGAPFRAGVHALDLKVPAQLQYDLLAGFEDVLGRITDRIVTSISPENASFALAEKFSGDIRAYRAELAGRFAAVGQSEPAGETQSTEIDDLALAGVPRETASDAITAEMLKNLVSIITIRDTVGCTFAESADIHLHTADLLGVDRLEKALDQLPLGDDWDRASFSALASDAASALDAIVLKAVSCRSQGEPAGDCLQRYLAATPTAKEYFESVRRFFAMPSPTVSAANVVVRLLARLAR